MTPVDVVVVGGSGFIGTRLCARLRAAGRTFAVVGRSASSAYPEESHVAEVGTDAFAAAVPASTTIVNLAAEHRDDVQPASRYKDVNVGGARQVCDVATGNGVRRIVFSSSVDVYGEANADEHARTVPEGPMGATSWQPKRCIGSGRRRSLRYGRWSW